MVNYIPKRGDFIRLTFDPQAVYEQKGNCTTLMLNQDKFNLKMGFIFVYPISNTKLEMRVLLVNVIQK